MAPLAFLCIPDTATSWQILSDGVEGSFLFKTTQRECTKTDRQDVAKSFGPGHLTFRCP